MSTPAGYSYKRSITVTNSVSASNYPILITINTAALVTAGKMRSDCNDILFHDTDDSTNCPYWIESGANTSSTLIWIKCSSLINGSITIYMYYGKSGESSANSNGDNTFTFFDDFPGTSINTTKWPSGNSQGTGWSVSGSVLSASSSGQQRQQSSTGFSAASAIRSRMSCGNTRGDVDNAIGFINSAASSYPGGCMEIYDTVTYWGAYDNGRVYGSIAYSTGYHIHEIKWLSSTSRKYYVDGSLNLNRTTSITAETGYPYLYCYCEAFPGIDWVLVRPCQDSEPTFSLGSETGTSAVSKILGLSLSSISKVSGVSAASIKKISGVS